MLLTSQWLDHPLGLPHDNAQTWRYSHRRLLANSLEPYVISDGALNTMRSLFPSVSSRSASAMFNETLHEPPTTVLVDLHCTFCWDGGRQQRPFRSLPFAARLFLEDRTTFIRSLDEACKDRLKSSTRHTAYGRHEWINWEAERYLIWQGMEDGRLPLSSLADDELAAQWDLMDKRQWQDSIQVHMTVEIKVGAGGLKMKD
jgi:hypothetical protein